MYQYLSPTAKRAGHKTYEYSQATAKRAVPKNVRILIANDQQGAGPIKNKAQVGMTSTNELMSTCILVANDQQGAGPIKNKAQVGMTSTNELMTTCKNRLL